TGPSSCVNRSFENVYIINGEQPHTVQVPYSLTLNVEELISPSSRSENTGKPPRPQNSFFLFRRDFEAKQRLLHKKKEETIYSKIISPLAADEWSKLSPLERVYFKELEQEALKKHSDLYPDYKYRPKKKKKDPNVGLTFVASQLEIPTPVNCTSDIMHNSNSNAFDKEEQYFDYNYNNHTPLTNDYNFDILEHVSFSTPLFETDDINNCNYFS
ncbi:27053_t:CDS:1, partial [Dentiscutata erythropus]